MKFCRNVIQVNTHRLTESDFRFASHLEDGGHGVFSRRKVPPSGECPREKADGQFWGCENELAAVEKFFGQRWLTPSLEKLARTPMSENELL